MYGSNPIGGGSDDPLEPVSVLPKQFEISKVSETDSKTRRTY